jgi:hypothetical protein
VICAHFGASSQLQVATSIKKCNKKWKDFYTCPGSQFVPLVVRRDERATTAAQIEAVSGFRTPSERCRQRRSRQRWNRIPVAEPVEGRAA